MRCGGLMHDAGEAYISDLPKPFKDGVSEYFDPHEEKILEVIASKYGLPRTYPDSVKAADWAMLICERYQVMADQALEWNGVSAHRALGRAVPQIEIQFWDPKTARDKFLERFEELT